MKLLVMLCVVFTVLSTFSAHVVTQKIWSDGISRFPSGEHAYETAPPYTLWVRNPKNGTIFYHETWQPRRSNYTLDSMTAWKLAYRPNYYTNIDMRFPYSEVPYLGGYDLVKIPASLNELIQHVDYWGEGKVVSEKGVRGFSNCYNVNHQYQVVSNGPDLNRKIPNRIPVRSDDNCDTSNYVKDNSVLTVTVAGARINSCAKDIARIVNNNHGKVIVYGVQHDSQEILDLAVELREKGLTSTPNTTLPSELQGLTYYDSHVVFLNYRDLEDELYKNVVSGNYDTAVNMMQCLAEATGAEPISKLVTRLISDAPRNVMSFAYKLWRTTVEGRCSGAKDIVRNQFLKLFQHIFNEEAVTIVNKQYQQPLKLDVNTDSYNDRLAWGDHNKAVIIGERVSWKTLPVWDSDGVKFKLYNIHCKMYLKLDANVDEIGDRKVWGSINSDEDRHLYYLEPLINDGTMVFSIVNYKYGQGLKLSLSEDNIGDRLVWGNKEQETDETHKYERFMWIIAAW